MSSESDPWPSNPEAALSRLVDEQGGRLYSLGLKFCGNATEAEDLVQETFILAYQNWESFEGRSKVSTWLYSIAARVCQKMHRKRAGEPDQIGSLEELLPFGEPRIAQTASEMDPADIQMIHIESREDLERAIAEMPQDFRMPLVLKDIIGLTVPEIASVMGMEEGTVKSRVHRARLKLRKLVDDRLPRTPDDVPPAAYPIQVCLDLLEAKQRSLDLNEEFSSEVICQRCQSVFASMDLAQDICQSLAEDHIPEGLNERLRKALSEL